MLPEFKKYIQILSYIALLSGGAISYAYDCAQLTTDLSGGQAPSPMALACIATRVVYLFVLFAGVVLLYMILWGALKLSMAQGNPKGFSGATNTWLYAFIGFVVVVGFFAVYRIIAGWVGLPSPDPNSLYELIESAIEGILKAAEIENY